MRYLLILFLFVSCSQQTTKTNTNSSFTLTPSMYGERIDVIICPPSEAQAIDSTMDFSTMNGLTISEGGEVIIWFPDHNQPPNVIDHELFHATYAVMDWVNIPLTESSEEAYAYMIDYLTKEFYAKYSGHN